MVCMMSGKVCPQCGTSIEFCPSCGKSIAAETQETEPVAEPASAESGKPADEAIEPGCKECSSEEVPQEVETTPEQEQTEEPVAEELSTEGGTPVSDEEKEEVIAEPGEEPIPEE